MKRIGLFLILLLWAANILTVILLIATAYSPHLQPAEHPVLSCLGLAFPIFALANGCFLVLWMLLRQWRNALAPLAGCLLCYASLRTYCPVNLPTDPLPEGTLKLLSYNVMAFNGVKKGKDGNAILNYLAQSEADILCLQEYATSSGKHRLSQADVDQALKAYPYHRIDAVGDRNARNRLACYSKYPILSARTLDYPSDYNGSVAYEVKVGEDTLLLINNHLESNKLTKEDKGMYTDMLKSPEKEKVRHGARLLVSKLAEASLLRAPQADAIAHELRRSRLDGAIVCGDFNDTPISYTHHTVAEHMDDAFVTSGCGLGISYNQNKFYFRIDHILISKNLKAYNCTVDHTIKESDHYPIWCHIGKKTP